MSFKVAYGYLRVSSKGQLDGYGPERQRQDIEVWAKANGIDVIKWFVESHTGTEANRPELLAMLGEVGKDCTVQLVLIESLDRLARDVMVQSTLLARMASQGVSLIAVNTGDDVTQAMKDDPMRKALVQIQAVFAELDKSLLVRKLARGRHAKKQTTGRCEGRLPFGSYEDEVETLERIRQLWRKPRNADRRNYSEITRVLNNEGWPTRSGKPWLVPTVRRIILANKWGVEVDD